MPNQSDKTALIIFAREPKDGKVKTRLARDLPVKTVTRLYRAFVKDVVAVSRKVRCDQKFIYYVGNGNTIPYLRSIGKQFQLHRQMGRDLGERMHKAFAGCRNKGFGRIIIIGTDCLTLTAKDIESAFHKLISKDGVLGPSRDGGYYLIGQRNPHKGLFTNVRWSTDKVLKKTLGNAHRLNQKFSLMKIREDIDTLPDLKRLAHQKNSRLSSPNTWAILQKLSL